jgi:iron complex transport system substrate-binding protein
MKIQYLIILFLAFSNCSSETEVSDTNKNVETTVEIKYAKNFNLTQKNNQYILEILDPISGKTESLHTIDPSKKHEAISLSATVVGMYAILNQQKQLKGVSSIDYVFDGKVKSMFKSGSIKEFGDETTNSIEKIISSKANTILYSGFGDEFPNQKKLEALNFTILPIYDWKEIHPLGKAEWIKVIGALTGEMDEAIKFFNTVEKEYSDLVKLTASIDEYPTCLSGNLIGDIWYTPASESYVAQLMKDAGSKYRYADTKGQVTLEFSIEQILKDNEKTEFWINPGYDAKSKIDKFNPHIKHLACYNNIYCYSPNMSKFWEQSAAEPHHVLSDLIHIFHPEIKEIKSFYYYAKIN